ncbi:hypothetical protein HPP92_007541 [Vanilla planifolia]|uniref:Uncharacterized protein n=1 Tax=Vanilla planifolia TaxID=51239 RepID=A0A835RHR5_VANPL|nr:hypothetical protein HPP92_007541 [Vanilla planifolia]
MLFDNGTGRASFDGVELSASSDTDSVSSGSNSGTPVLHLPRQARVSSQGVSMPARFWQETNSRIRSLPEPLTPLASSGPRNSAAPKLVSVRRSLIDRPLHSPRTTSSPLRGLARPSSPSKLESSPARGISSPSRPRVCSTLASSSPAGLPANAPSIISFAAEVRRNKKGEIRIEEAHMLRLLHNRHLQWRCVNARTSACLMLQRVAAEKNLCDSCITTTDMRDSITVKKIKLHLLAQHLKLMAILKGQMIYLEEWSLLDREHSSSLLGSTEALKASIIRLPIVGGARADMQDVKDAVGSAVDVMQAMGASIYSLLSKVEKASSLVLELAKDSELELALLVQSRELLSTVAALHVKLCSLQGQLLQAGRIGVPNRS